MSSFTLPAGLATVTGIAVLENPRKIDNDKSVYFDASLYCEDGDGLGILACLRYFNSRDYVFGERPAAYFITANVVRPHTAEDAPNIASEQLKTNDAYCLVGDIISLTPASIEDATPEHPVLVHATGYLTAAKKESNSLTFELAPEPYTHAYSKYHKSPSVKKVSFPLRAALPTDSARWKNVPNLQPGHIVTITGFLGKVIRTSDDDDDLDSKGDIIAFELSSVDQLQIVAKTTVPVASQDPTSSTPAKRKEGVKFAFGTPSPAMKKPRTENQSGGASTRSRSSK